MHPTRFLMASVSIRDDVVALVEGSGPRLGLPPGGNVTLVGGTGASETVASSSGGAPRVVRASELVDLAEGEG